MTRPIVVYSVTEEHIQTSNNIGIMYSVASTKSALDLLLDATKDSINLFSHLDEDVARLLHLLQVTPDKLKELATSKKTALNLDDTEYTLAYIPSKWFSIDRGHGYGHPYVGFSDLGQYVSRTDVTGDNLPETLEAQQKLAQEVYGGFAAIGLSPINLISPTNAYRKEVLDKLDIPRFDDVPQEAMEIAYECCTGGWVEAFSIGHFPMTYDYDLISAYPSQGLNLKDLRQGSWLHSKDYQPNATYGYCRCEVFIDPKSPVSPIIYQVGDHSYTPSGIFCRSLTKAQIDYINLHLGYATILDGWWWTVRQRAYPLRAEIQRLYNLKHQATGMTLEIIKRIMAGSFYGIFLEMRDTGMASSFGPQFLSPWAAEIENNTHLRIADLCRDNDVVPLHIAVDGVLTNKTLSLHNREDAKPSIGGWHLSHSGPAYICSSGLVAQQAKPGTGDFAVTYDYLAKRIAENPLADHYVMSSTQTTTLQQAIALDTPLAIGTPRLHSHTITLGDNKREYNDFPDTFGELSKGQYSSRPWPAPIINVIEHVVETKEEE